MVGILVQIAQFLLSLTILVVLHELGHFTAARLCKVRVEKFYVFFNPWFSLFKKQIGEVEFGLGWLPLGGYCKIAGMVDESMDTVQVGREPRPDDFISHPAWQRLIIISAGVIVNLLLAWVIYTGLLYSSGDVYLDTRDVKYGIVPDSIAREMGFEAGDRLVAVNGDTIHDFNEILSEAMLTPDARVTLERDGKSCDVTIDKRYLSEIVQGGALFSIRMPFVVGGTSEGSEAARAGMLEGDTLVAIDGLPAHYFDEFRTAVRSHAGQELKVDVRRGEVVHLTLNVPPEGIVGVYADSRINRYLNVRSKEYTLLQAIPAGASRGVGTLSKYLKSLKLLFVPQAKAHKSIGGFISIGKIFPDHWNWENFWSLTAFLSLVLAVMNFLPIPGLDGGHAIFILYEMVTGRSPSHRFLIVAQLLGMGFLILLMLYANANDVIKLFH